MRLTRRLTLAFAGSALVGLAGAASAQDAKTFALVQINQQALFFNQMNAGAQAAADAAGAELLIFNANNDPAADYPAAMVALDAVIVTEAIPLANHLRWSDTEGSVENFYTLAAQSNPNVTLYLQEGWQVCQSV